MTTRRRGEAARGQYLGVVRVEQDVTVRRRRVVGDILHDNLQGVTVRTPDSTLQWGARTQASTLGSAAAARGITPCALNSQLETFRRCSQRGWGLPRCPCMI